MSEKQRESKVRGNLHLLVHSHQHCLGQPKVGMQKLHPNSPVGSSSASTEMNFPSIFAGNWSRAEATWTLGATLLVPV